MKAPAELTVCVAFKFGETQIMAKRVEPLAGAKFTGEELQVFVQMMTLAALGDAERTLKDLHDPKTKPK